MAQTNVNFRMDEDLKKDLEEFCSDVGMNLTTAFTMFAKVVTREQKLPFEVGTGKDPFYSSENQARLLKSIAQMETTGGTFHEVNLDDSIMLSTRLKRTP